MTNTYLYKLENWRLSRILNASLYATSSRFIIIIPLYSYITSELYKWALKYYEINLLEYSL